MHRRPVLRIPGATLRRSKNVLRKAAARKMVLDKTIGERGYPDAQDHGCVAGGD